MNILPWLLNSDPALRWQVLRDLTPTPADTIAQERARIATEGWGERLLSLQLPDGTWDGGACFPANFQWGQPHEGQPWTSTLPVLQLLHDFGIDPTHPRVQHAIAQVRDHCRWEHDGQPFFEGEVEPCINARVITLGTYFGQTQHINPIITRLLSEQLPDGGWNCEAERGSTRSSFHTTINVLEALLTHERATGTTTTTAARWRGEEYLLERHLLRRKSTNEIINPTFLQCRFPARWHYDILRALDYFRAVGNPPDPRINEAIQILRSKKLPDGTWPLDHTLPGKTYFQLEEGDGKPSRWNTLRALRVLNRFDTTS